MRLRVLRRSIPIIITVIASENEITTTITSKGQVTIPTRIRDALQLEPGNSVEFSVNREGEVILRLAK